MGCSSWAELWPSTARRGRSGSGGTAASRRKPLARRSRSFPDAAPSAFRIHGMDPPRLGPCQISQAMALSQSQDRRTTLKSPTGIDLTFSLAAPGIIVHRSPLPSDTIGFLKALSNGDGLDLPG